VVLSSETPLKYVATIFCVGNVKFDPSPYNVPPDIVVADNTFILAVNADPVLSFMVKVFTSSYVNPVTYVFV